MIGTRIKDYRKKQALSLSELALRANVAKSYLSSVERNIQKNPSLQFIEKVAAVLKIDSSLLINDVQDKEMLLDAEWLALAYEAQSSGINKEEFNQFLEFTKWQQGQKEHENQQKK